MKQVIPPLARRRLFAGAATAAGLAATARLLPAQAPGQEAPASPSPPSRGGGYRLSEHVLKYFKTTRV